MLFCSRFKVVEFSSLFSLFTQQGQSSFEKQVCVLDSWVDDKEVDGGGKAHECGVANNFGG